MLIASSITDSCCLSPTLKALLTVAWLAGVVYASIPLFWIPTHPLAAFWRKRSWHPLKVLAPVWFALIAILLAVTFAYRYERFYEAWWSWVLPLPLAAFSLLTYRTVMRGNFDRDTLIGKTELESKREQRLYTGGMHGVVRHPIYLAHILHFAYWTLASGLVVNWVMFVAALPLFGLIIWMEDRELERRFGDEFRAYRSSVPALLPRRIR